jgi:hypothetical protein
MLVECGFSEQWNDTDGDAIAAAPEQALRVWSSYEMGAPTR